MAEKMEMRTGSQKFGFVAQLTIPAGETRTLHIPVPPEGRHIGVRAWPGDGGSVVLEDSQSPDAAVLTDTARWMPMAGDGIAADGTVSAAGRWSYTVAVSGIRITAVSAQAVLEVMA